MKSSEFNSLGDPSASFVSALSASSETSFEVLATEAAKEASKQAKFAEKMAEMASDYAKGLQAVANGYGNAAEGAFLKNTANQILSSVENFRSQSASLQQAAGAFAAKAASAASMAKGAGAFGIAYDGYAYVTDLNSAVTTGDWEAFGTTAASIGTSAAFGAQVAGAGIAMGAAIGTFLGVVGAPLVAVVAVTTALVVGGAVFLGNMIGPMVYEGWKQIANAVSDFFSNSKNFEWPRDPLALDLDGDGIETIGADGTVLFDHNGDGTRRGTGWVKGDDGLLVLDKDGNGSIDSGAELFGIDYVKSDNTKASDGFDALRDLDSNADGVFDANDAQFANVQVWRDLDQDGVSDAGELMSLTDAGIASIGLNDTAFNQALAGGNQMTSKAAFTRTDNTTGTVGNLNLASSNFYREFGDTITVSDTAQALPNMMGSGNVRDLREAATQSSRLAGLLAQYSAATTRDAQWALLDEMLDAWADTTGMAEALAERDPGAFYIRYDAFGTQTRANNLNSLMVDGSGGSGGNEVAYIGLDKDNLQLNEAYRNLIAAWDQKMHILEAFNGEYFFSLPEQETDPVSMDVVGLREDGSTAAETWAGGRRTLVISYAQQQLNFLQQSYDALKQSVYEGLLTQTRLKPYLDAVELVIDENGVSFDFAALGALFESNRGADAENALIDLIELTRNGGTLLNAGWNGIELLKTWAQEASGNATLETILAQFSVMFVSGTGNASSNDSTLFGSAGNDYLYGKAGGDLLVGGEGMDYIFGRDGDDIIVGGAGNDYLFGEAGSDTYLFGRG
ncbi:MAG TPA: calcium-binding protein, partial [Denitromonas sp.]|nr:calcium-binding protein [Denitromonas sp.]